MRLARVLLRRSVVMDCRINVRLMPDAAEIPRLCEERNSGRTKVRGASGEAVDNEVQTAAAASVKEFQGSEASNEAIHT